MPIDRDILSKVRRLSNEVKPEITSRQFFDSPEFSQHVQSVVNTITGKYDEKVKVTLVKDGSIGTACTNGKLIYQNPFCELTMAYSTLINQYYAQMGLTLHECAHILYKNFDYDELARKKLTEGTFLGGEPETESFEESMELDSMLEALDEPQLRGIFTKIHHELSNIISDVHDENKLIKNFGKFPKRSIETIRGSLLTSITPLEDMLASRDGLSIMFMMLLQQARYGKVVCTDENDPIVKQYLEIIEPMKEPLRIATETDSSIEKYAQIKRIMLLMWSYIENMLENQQFQFQPSQCGDGNSKNQKQSGQSSNSQDQSGQSSQGQSSQNSNSQNQNSQSQNSQSSQNRQSGSGQGSNQGSSTTTTSVTAQSGSATGSQSQSTQNQSESAQNQSNSKQSQSGSNQNQRSKQSIEEAIQQIMKDLEAAAQNVGRTAEQKNGKTSESNDSGKNTSNVESAAGSITGGEGADSDEKEESSKSEDGDKQNSSSEQNLDSDKQNPDGDKQSSDGNEQDSDSDGQSSDSNEQSSSDEQGSDGDDKQDSDGGDKNSQGDSEDNPKDNDNDSDDNSIDDVLNNVLQQLAERMAQERLQNQELTALGEKVRAVNQNNTHKGLRTYVCTMNDVTPDDIETYNRLMEDLKSYSVRLQRQISQALTDLQQGSVTHHRHIGKTFESNAAYRPDQRYYAHKKLPKDIPEMAISLLVDHSGSMYGKRIEASQKAAMLLYDVATHLNIPVAVNGHNSAFGGINYYVYTDYRKVSENEKYRLAKMSTGSCNRDGMALEVSLNLLSQRPEEIKLCVIISDGQPNDIGYGGQEAAKDIQSIVKRYQKKGIEVIAAAIGSDKQNIKEIYGEQSFLDIDDLDALPKVMAKLLRKKLLD